MTSRQPLTVAALVVATVAASLIPGRSGTTTTTPATSAEPTPPATSTPNPSKETRPLRPSRSARRHTIRRRHHPAAIQRPLNWRALAYCEATGNPRAVSPNGRYFGLYQFDLPTWRSVGGRGNPADASPAEQTYRAQLLYAQAGRAPWPACGRLL